MPIDERGDSVPPSQPRHDVREANVAPAPPLAKAIYGGSFDPIHLGHVDLVRRGSRLFRPLVVAIGENPRKDHLFRLEERLEMARAETAGIEGIEVESFRGLLVDHARSRGCRVTLRGLRALSDFEYEYRMGMANRGLDPDLETVCLLADPRFAFLSSSLLREIAAGGGDVSGYLSPAVRARLAARLDARPAP